MNATITEHALADLLLLETVKQFGPQKFKELHQAALSPGDVLVDPDRLPFSGKRGDGFRVALRALADDAREVALARAQRQLERADEFGARILTYASPDYPASVYASSNPIPVLYALGSARVLAGPGVACVGSRQITEPYRERHRAFAAYASRRGKVIVSGFALGADTIGHEAANEAGGATTLVMPCGLDRPFPPENKVLYQRLLDDKDTAVVSEFSFGTAASTLTLRKRNKLIVALAGGVLLSQASAKGGAMNAYRCALEQRRPIATFAGWGDEATSGNDVIARHLAFPDPNRPADVTVFPADRDATEDWERWLRELQ